MVLRRRCPRIPSRARLPTRSTGEEPPPIVPGLFAEYFARYHDVVVSRVEPAIDAVWGMAAPDPAMGVDRFSVRWSGWLTAPSTGTYTIATETDDGVRLFLDDELVIDDWTPHFVTRNEARSSSPPASPCRSALEYFEIDLDASARLLVVEPAQPKRRSARTPSRRSRCRPSSRAQAAVSQPGRCRSTAPIRA